MVVVKYLSRLIILFCQAIVLANSDCPMEDQAGLEHLRESLLSSLHDAVNYIRFFINIDDTFNNQIINLDLATEIYI